MKSLLKKYSNYLSIIGAILIFGSWIITSLLTESVKTYESKLAFLISKDESENATNNLHREFSNLTKLILRNRSLELPKDVQGLKTGQQRFYEWTKEYEVCNSFYEDWTRLKDNADNVHSKIEYINPVRSISLEFQKVYVEINDLHEEFQQSKQRVDSVLPSGTSNNTLLKDIDDNLADQAADSIQSLRNLIRDTKIGTNYIILANKLYQVEYKIKETVENKLTFYRACLNIFKYLSILLYLLGTSLTIYSKFMETKSKETVTAP